MGHISPKGTQLEMAETHAGQGGSTLLEPKGKAWKG